MQAHDPPSLQPCLLPQRVQLQLPPLWLLAALPQLAKLQLAPHPSQLLRQGQLQAPSQGTFLFQLMVALKPNSLLGLQQLLPQAVVLLSFLQQGPLQLLLQLLP